MIHTDNDSVGAAIKWRPEELSHQTTTSVSAENFTGDAIYVLLKA